MDENISEISSELSVVSGSEGFEGTHEVLGDDFAVHDNVFSDDLHVRNWALSNIDDVVESVPVSGFGVDSLADWETLLEALDGCNGGDGSSDEFLVVFGLESVLDHFNILVNDLSNLVHLIDADEEVGEVESSNLGSLQETLHHFGNHHVVNFVLLDWEVLDGLKLVFGFGGFLEDLSHLLAEGEVVTLFVSFGGLSTIDDNANSVDGEIFLENLEVIHWVGNHVEGLIETLVVEGGGINGFAGWETLFELLNGADNSNDGTNEVGIILGLDGSLEGLVSNIEHESSLILIIDALEESLNVEVSTEGGEDSSECLGNLVFGFHMSELLLRSKKSLGGSLTNLITEVVPLLGFVVIDGSLDLTKDLNTVDQNVLTNVVSESLWALKDGSHLDEFLPVSLDVRAVRHTGFDLLDEISDVFKSSNNVLGILLLEVTNSGLNIRDDVLTILNAFVDIIETFGIEGSSKETTNDFFNLFDINLFWLSGFGGSSAEEESKSKFVHFRRVKIIL